MVKLWQVMGAACDAVGGAARGKGKEVAAAVAWMSACAGAFGGVQVPVCGPGVGEVMTAGVNPEAGVMGGLVGWFDNYGAYVPRIHCIQDAEGRPDWLWIGALLVLTGGVVVAYLRIFWFWRQSYREVAEKDRNKKLMDLAWVFLLCAVCGYVMSIVSFWWPAYRLLAVFLLALNVFSWRFVGSISAFRVSFSAHALQRQLDEARVARTAELERQVLERTREAEEARRCAEQADRAKSDFLANMSHELRTPLTSILGYSEVLLEEGKLDGESAVHARAIFRNGEHLLSVINDVLDLSKIEAGRMELERVPTGLMELLQESVELMRPRAVAKGLELALVVETAMPSAVMIDPLRVRQVVFNLLGNSVKFTQTGSVKLIVGGGEVGGKFEVRMRAVDTGIGMDENQIKRLFQPFTQGDSGVTRRFGGTGLGLTISRRLVMMMGGTIGVESRAGEGSTFTVTVPVEIAEGSVMVEVGKRGGGAVEEVSKVESGAIDARVLLVEDGPDNRRLISHILKRLGAVVETAENGQVGVEMAMSALGRGSVYDLIVMDMQMPVMDGYAAARMLRQLGVATPILALTANAMVGDDAKCFAAGCSHFASKPIDRRGFAELCREIVEESRRKGRVGEAA